MRKHRWTVRLQADHGQLFNQDVVAGWDPKKVTEQEIGVVAAIEKGRETKGVSYAPISVGEAVLVK